MIHEILLHQDGNKSNLDKRNKIKDKVIPTLISSKYVCKRNTSGKSSIIFIVIIIRKRCILMKKSVDSSTVYNFEFLIDNGKQHILA